MTRVSVIISCALMVCPSPRTPILMVRAASSCAVGLSFARLKMRPAVEGRNIEDGHAAQDAEAHHEDKFISPRPGATHASPSSRACRGTKGEGQGRRFNLGGSYSRTPRLAAAAFRRLPGPLPRSAAA